MHSFHATPPVWGKPPEPVHGWEVPTPRMELGSTRQDMGFHHMCINKCVYIHSDLFIDVHVYMYVGINICVYIYIHMSVCYEYVSVWLRSGFVDL